jgi:hypothetical protein
MKHKRYRVVVFSSLILDSLAFITDLVLEKNEA